MVSKSLGSSAVKTLLLGNEVLLDVWQHLVRVLVVCTTDNIDLGPMCLKVILRSHFLFVCL